MLATHVKSHWFPMNLQHGDNKSKTLTKRIVAVEPFYFKILSFNISLIGALSL